MKKAEEVLDTLYNFTETQKAKLNSLAADIVSLKEQRISKETYDTIYNCIKELDSLRDNIIIRLLASMKRGDII